MKLHGFKDDIVVIVQSGNESTQVFSRNSTCKGLQGKMEFMPQKAGSENLNVMFATKVDISVFH
jgi:hypothetical protein